MALTAIVTLTSSSTDTGPFYLFSDVDGYTSPFERNIPKLAMLAGYVSTVVPNGTTTVRIKSGGFCIEYIDVPLTTP